MRILVTRPEPDGERFAALLRPHGVEPVLEPLLEIRFDGGALPDLAGVQALLLTSANGVRALQAACGGGLPAALAELPVVAVGEASAAEARQAGFRRVQAAGGEVNSLAAAVTESLRPADGALVHVRGRDVAGDLAGMLAAAGFEVRPAILYRAEPCRALSPALQAALRAGGLDGVALLSARTARTFVGLLQAAGLERAAAGLDIFCLSKAVAAAAAGPSWRRVGIAAAPDATALAELIAAAAGRGGLQGVES